LAKGSSERYDLGERLLVSAPRIFRKRGAVLVCSSQTVSSLPPAVLGNLSTVFALRISDGGCIQRLATSMSLSPEQREILPELEFRQAVVHMKACRGPFLAEVPESLAPVVPSETEVEERIRESVAQLPYVPYDGEDPVIEEAMHEISSDEESETLIGGLPPDQYKVMVALCGGALTPEDICVELRWDRKREGDARKALDAAGMLQLAGRVAHWKIHEPTSKGLAWAKENRVAVAAYATKGGAVHAFCLRQFEEALSRAAQGVRFQRSGLTGVTSGVQPDTLALFRDGWRVAVQVCHRNAPDYESRQLLELCRIENIDRVVSVASSRACQDHIEKEVRKTCGQKGRKGAKRADKQGGIPDRLIMTCLSECLSESFDWGLITGKGSDSRKEGVGQDGAGIG